MVTRNWYNIFKANRAYGVIDNALKDMTGTVSNAGYATSSTAATAVLNSLLFRAENVVYATGGSSSALILGSGTTPPTIDDYMLESMITSPLTTSVSRSFDENNDTIFSISVTNSNADPVTISEVGLKAPAYTGSNNSSYVAVLVERTVLDSPLTIPAGDTGLITYVIKMPTPGE